MADLSIECSQCDGWGFLVFMSNQWEEDTLIDCSYCDSLGLVPIECEGEEIVVQSRHNSGGGFKSSGDDGNANQSQLYGAGA